MDPITNLDLLRHAAARRHAEAPVPRGDTAPAPHFGILPLLRAILAGFARRAA
jgi:hypothetical protein